MATWYRPPRSSHHLLYLFEELIDRIDIENSRDNYTTKLINICDVYNLSQFITDILHIFIEYIVLDFDGGEK